MVTGKNRSKMVRAVWVLKHTSKCELVRSSRVFAQLREEYAEIVGANQQGVRKSEAHRQAIAAGRRKAGAAGKIKGRYTKEMAIAYNTSRVFKQTERGKQLISAASSGANNPRAKTWEIEAEDGVVLVMKSMKPWCEARGLVANSLSKTLKTGTFYRGFRVLSCN
jgi:hypothetical protein